MLSFISAGVMDDLDHQLSGIEAAKSGKKQNAGVSADLLLPLVYEELRRLAAQKIATEPAGQTLQATALVHEAWLRLGGERQSWENRAHFYVAAAEAMRRILIDTARRKKTAKRGGGLERVDADAIHIEVPVPDDKLLELHEALELLAAHDARKAELVKLRYFAGMSIDEAAEVLGISTPTAKRDWIFARAWMQRKIKAGDSRGSKNRISPKSSPQPKASRGE